MILAAGLTPAWQQILQLSSLECGEVNRLDHACWCSSGKVLNVGMAAHALSGEDSPVKTLSVIGGQTGKAVQEEFAQRQIPAHWIESPTSTRVCTTILETGPGRTTELVENAGAMTTQELEKFQTAYRDEMQRATVVVLTGSLPQSTPVGFYRELLEQTSCPAILDVRGPELLEALSQRPFLVKPNRQELEQTLNRKFTTNEELLLGMKELCQQGAEWVLVTQGAGPVWGVSLDYVFRFTPLVAPVINAIGCGDCLAAGIAWGIARGETVPRAIQLGMAAAALNLGELLPARIDRQETLLLAEKIALKEIQKL